MNVVILAGGILTSEDALTPLLPDGLPKNKAYAMIGGKPMIQWVLDAINGSAHIGEIIIVGLKAETYPLESRRPAHYLEDHGGLIDNIMAGVKHSAQLSPQETHSLISSCDIPAITSQMVDWVVQNGQKTGADLIYHVIEESTMEARFPGANRTFAPLKDMRVCGGDLNMVANKVTQQDNPVFERLTAARKNVLKQAAIFGPRLLLGILFRRLGLVQVAEYLSKRLDITAKAVVCPYAEIAMDVDKPHQLALLRTDLEKTLIAE